MGRQPRDLFQVLHRLNQAIASSGIEEFLHGLGRPVTQARGAVESAHVTQVEPAVEGRAAEVSCGASPWSMVVSPKAFVPNASRKGKRPEDAASSLWTLSLRCAERHIGARRVRVGVQHATGWVT